MIEWWTYSLSDFLLFSPRTYFRLFEIHNAAIWPGQLPALAAGTAVLLLLLRSGAWRGRIVAALLAAAWLWVAWSYLLTRYATINWAAGWMAAAFVAQALALVVSGVLAGRLQPAAPPRRAAWIGLGLVWFALAVQPLVGPALGRPWLQVQVFAVAPDPTVAATLGALLAAARMPWELLAIPLAWCAVSGATLWTMQAPDAWLLPAAGMLVLLAAGWAVLSRVRGGQPVSGYRR